MSLRYFYRPDWSTTPSVELTDNVRLYTLDCTENAEESNPGMFTLLVDDDEGALDIPALTRIWATETEISATSNTFVFHGYIMDRTVRRGSSGLTSAARVWEVNVADENSIISRRVLSSTSANRPAETDVARVQWLANEADGQLLIDDTTFLSTASPVAMDAADYRGQTGAEVLNDAAQASGKNHWFYFKEGVGSAIWYGANDLTTHNSMLRLSNVLGEVDNVTTFAISQDTRLVRDPSRMVSGVYYQYAEHAVYVRNMAMFPEIGMRDLPYSSTNVKTQAKATARANRYLANNNSEDDRITTSVRVPAAKVNWIRHGMRIPFKATHLPGYEDYVFLRVLRRSVVHDSEDPVNTYLLTLELATDTIPPSPSSPGQPSGTPLTADLEIGSASFLGLPADRENHYASDLGATLPALVVGREYRLVADVIFCLETPINGSSSMSSGIRITEPGDPNAVFSPTYGWTPGNGTNNGIVSYEGISYSFDSTGTMVSNYKTGTHYVGDWLRWDGPAIPGGADINIHGAPNSGFYGFHWTVHVELQER